MVRKSATNYTQNEINEFLHIALLKSNMTSDVFFSVLNIDVIDFQQDLISNFWGISCGLFNFSTSNIDKSNFWPVSQKCYGRNHVELYNEHLSSSV